MGRVFWVFRNGDSGRGKEGLTFCFSAGLEARPGPVVWANLDDICGGVLAFASPRPPRLNDARDEEVGVGGIESEDTGDKRL